MDAVAAAHQRALRKARSHGGKSADRPASETLRPATRLVVPFGARGRADPLTETSHGAPGRRWRPAFHLPDGQAGMTLRIRGAPLLDVRKGCSRQQVQFLRQMADRRSTCPPMWGVAGRPVSNLDAIVLAGAGERLRVEFLAVVDVDHLGQAGHRPFGRKAARGQPVALISPLKSWA